MDIQEWVFVPSFFGAGPIGLGIFLMGRGVLYWGMSKDRESRRDKNN